MTFFIGPECIDVKDRSCVEECPVDCIYEGGRKMYINPEECIDCGYCVTVCPVEAIFADSDGDEGTGWLADNETFFTAVLDGRSEPIGNPGGSLKSGEFTVDTPMAVKYEVN